MTHLFKILSFLARCAKGIPYARFQLVLILATSILGGAASAGFIAVINTRVTTEGTASGTLLWSFLGLCIALPVLRFTSNILLVFLSGKAVIRMRIELSRNILRAPLRHLEEIGAGGLLATMTQDVGTIIGMLVIAPLFLMHITVVVGCLAYMAWLSPTLFAVVLGAVVLGVLTYRLPVARAQRLFAEGREVWDVLMGHLRGLTEGVKELKMHQARAEAFVVGNLESTSYDMFRKNARGTVIFAAANSWGQVLFFVVIGIVIFLLPNFQVVSTTALTGYAFAILYMIQPLNNLMQQLPNLSQGSVAINKVEGLGLDLAEKASERAGDGRLALTAGSGEAPWRSLELRGATHSYWNAEGQDSFSLGPLDLSFEPGELVFLIGGNGSGKTTLAKLLVGLYAPESGEVYLDGQRVTDQTRSLQRQLFSVVFTDFHLFDTLLGLEHDELDAQAREYLSLLMLDGKVSVEGGKLSTVELSQGQRKRLALLTAYLEDRPIYLFDEWAADQDPMFKEVFYLQLLPELRQRGKTVLVISHDDRYYHLADRLIKLDYGVIEYDRRLEEDEAPVLQVPGVESRQEAAS